MKNLAIYMSATILALFLLTLIAWFKGNTNEYEYEIRTDIRHSDVEKELGKKPESNKKYYYKTVLIETVKPAKFPGFWESKVDTISHEIMSKSR